MLSSGAAESLQRVMRLFFSASDQWEVHVCHIRPHFLFTFLNSSGFCGTLKGSPLMVTAAFQTDPQMQEDGGSSVHFKCFASESVHVEVVLHARIKLQR